MEAGRRSESQATMFHDLLTADPKQGYVVPPLDHLKDEAYVILGAAADTTGNAMSVAAYEVVSDPVKYQRLTAELKAAFPDPTARLDYLALEKLPYLVSFSDSDDGHVADFQ
jgi:cytochrome P450